jgi:predicted ATPase
MRIVFTGGPSSGKTTIIKELSKEAIVVEEPARYLLTKHGDVLFQQREYFQSLLEGLCIENFNKYPDAFYDRGLPDEIAYRTICNCAINDKLKKECSELRYDIIFVFPPWKAIYENDEIRRETFEESEVVYTEIVLAYTSYGYTPVVVPFGTVEERVNFIKKIVKEFGGLK